MDKPLVSILIPVYNRQDLIVEAAESALNQTYQNIEIIIVDNASTDNTWEVCNQLAKKDSRIKIWQNDRNIGPVLNWEKCIEKAQGEYGKILFSDDLIQPNFLEETIPFLEDSQVGFVFTAAEVGFHQGDGNNSLLYRWGEGKRSSSEYFKDLLFAPDGTVPHSPCAALFRLKDLAKNLLTDIPSPTIKDFKSHGAGPDLLLYLLAAHQYAFIAHIRKPLVFFCQSEDSITMSSKRDILNCCYTQSIIWFSSQYLSRKEQELFLVQSWLKYCFRKKLTTFTQYSNKYVKHENNCNYSKILYCILLITYLKISRRFSISNKV
jgi:glycosyltransferase involved in cell wall biosynthesis